MTDFEGFLVQEVRRAEAHVTYLKEMLRKLRGEQSAAEANPSTGRRRNPASNRGKVRSFILNQGVTSRNAVREALSDVPNLSTHVHALVHGTREVRDDDGTLIWIGER